MTSPRGNAAIFYVPDAFKVNRADLKGRHAAGASMLAGLGRHLQAPSMYCLAGTREEFDDFARTVWDTSGRKGEVRWINWQRLRQASEPGCVFTADPGLGRFARPRLAAGIDSFSLCGLTHSLSSREIFDLIGEYPTAPLASWDALICTSRVARAAVTGLLDEWEDFHRRRGWSGQPMRPQLPVIPLGVHAGQFRPPDAAERRAAMREQYGIQADDVVFLFLGRLTYHAKAHPVPMLLALEKAAKRTGKRVFLMLAGRFPVEPIELQFRRALALHCPSVRCILVDGRDDAACDAAWHAADVFTSLSDNIQETFGLTIIEAMAAGLPVVASDWDGYKDTVVDGETGFRVATVAPRPGSGEELGAGYEAGSISYDRYIGYASLCTSVNVEAAAAAYVHLIESPDVRARLGANGRRRAEQVYDWRNIVPAYQALWGELADRRAADGPGLRGLRSPTWQDPFRLFQAFPTSVIGLADLLERTGDDSEVELMLAGEMMKYGFPAICSEADIRHVAAQLATGRRPLADLIVAETPEASHALERACLWLLKFGLVRLLPRRQA